MSSKDRKVVYIYTCTSDSKTLDRLSGSVIQQETVSSAIFENSFLLLDKRGTPLPRAIRRAFGSKLSYEDPFVTCNETGKAFCLSKYRNASFKIAQQLEVDWLVLCDADTIITQPPELHKNYHYMIPDVYWQRSQGETIKESLKIIDNEGKSAFSDGNSWFTLHRDIFSKIDFNENFIGYGYEDIEFSHRMKLLGVPLYIGSGQIVHRYHSHAERRINERQFDRNLAVYLASTVALNANIYSPWHKVNIVETIHPEWQEFLWLDYNRNIAIHARKKAIGHFTQVENNVKIVWDGQHTDFFSYDNNVLKFEHH